jgi:hypothetical protein
VKPVAILLLLLSLCPYARAGLVFEESTKHLAPRQDPPLNMRAFFELGKLRVQFVDDRAYPLIIRDGALYMLNPSDRTYQVLDKDAMAQLAANATEARKKSEENLQKLSPAQRAMIQPVIDQQAQKLVEERQPLDLRRTNRHENVGGHRCVVWEYYFEGAKQAEACVAPPSALAQGAQILKAMGLVSDFLAVARQSLGEAAALLFQIPSHQSRMQAAVAQQLNGVALLWRDFRRDGSRMDETELTAAHEEKLDPATFEVPAGYTQQSLSSVPIPTR